MVAVLLLKIAVAVAFGQAILSALVTSFCYLRDVPAVNARSDTAGFQLSE